MTALQNGWNKKKKEKKRLARSPVKKSDGGIIQPHPLFAALFCMSDLGETFGLEEDGG